MKIDKMQIIPAILEKTVDDFNETFNRFSSFFNRFQIDIQDGIYVYNKTVQIEELISNITFETKKAVFDIHLMVQNPEVEIAKLKLLKKKVKIKNIFVHLPFLTSKLLHQFPEFSIGLVINPDDSIKLLSEKVNLKNVPFVQIMTIKPGPQGQDFMPNQLNKIEQLRLLGYRSNIFLDGGINDKTIPLILAKKYQPDYLCVGSYLTRCGNILEIKRRIELIESYVKK